MVVARIQVGQTMDLVIIQKSAITGVRCRDEIILTLIIPLAQQQGSKLFMDGNAHPHSAYFVNSAPSDHLTLIDWLAQSPDSSPIEHA